MVIYGRNSTLLKSEQAPTAICPNCETKGSIVFSIYSQHAHIFWIPFFPIGKTGGSSCGHCKQVLKSKEMPDELRRDYNNFKSDLKPKIWQFSGLALIGIFAIWISYSNKEDAKKELSYLNDPMVGDVYEYKTEGGNYSTFKIWLLEEDTLFLLSNEYETNKMSGIREIDVDSNYTDFPLPFLKVDIMEMYKSGEIYDVHRE